MKYQYYIQIGKESIKEAKRNHYGFYKSIKEAKKDVEEHKVFIKGCKWKIRRTLDNKISYEGSV